MRAVASATTRRWCARECARVDPRVDRRRFAARATFADDARLAVVGEARALGAAVARHIADADMVVCFRRTDARGGGVVVEAPNAR